MDPTWMSTLPGNSLAGRSCRVMPAGESSGFERLVGLKLHLVDEGLAAADVGERKTRVSKRHSMWAIPYFRLDLRQRISEREVLPVSEKVIHAGPGILNICCCFG